MRQEQSQGNYVQSRGRPGTLFIVGVPIGHPDDLTIRGLATLRHVSLIATKNPSATQALLAHHRIRTMLTTYDRMNASEKAPVILAKLKQGIDVALVSDCGMPIIYDPGRLLISAAAAARIPIDVIPGASAVVTAAAVAGMDSNAFVFEGRCSGNVRALTRRFQSLKTETRTMIFFPLVHALRSILILLSTLLGNRRVVLASDLTYKTQQVVRGRIQEVLDNRPLREGCRYVTLVVEGTRAAKKRARGIR